MQKFIAAAKNFMSDESGATMVEYALMVALIAVVAAVGATALGVAVNGQFNAITGSL